MKIHRSVTQERVVEAVERETYTLDNPGICLACGADHHACEPDARNYTCLSCGGLEVFGASEILIMGAFHT